MDFTLPASTPFTLRGQACPNSDCERHLKEGEGNVVIHSRKTKRFQCNVCKRSWVAHRNTPRYRMRTKPIAVQQAAEWLAHGLSIRLTARRLHVSPSTVLRWKKKSSSFNNIP